jgi:RNA polymerase sigma-70 factor (ECF subfamily)
MDGPDPLADLMKRVALGDEVAFAELVRRTKPLVAGVIYRFVGHARETEDLAQEVYLRVWEARRRYEPSARFTTWIGTITARLCMNEREKLSRRQTLPYPPMLAPTTIKLSLDDAEAVRDALLALTDAQRMAVVLRYFGDLSDRGTAEALGVSLSAAQALLFRARQKLIDLLPERVDLKRSL